jgi:hypothetical protein
MIYVPQAGPGQDRTGNGAASCIVLASTPDRSEIGRKVLFISLFFMAFNMAFK